MGCDIHLYTESKKNDSERWHNRDNWVLNEYYMADGSEGPIYQVNPLYKDRDYRLFHTLAMVRSYGDTAPTMGEAKGLPLNVSEVVQQEADGWAGDAHSHSSWTLKELKDFQENNKDVTYSGLVTLEAARNLLDNIYPSSSCQGSSDKTLVHRTWTEPCEILKPIIDELDARMRDIFWIFDSARHIEKEEQIRIVFWFDN